MKLRTSFFNIHVLKKNLIRFAPVWVLFTVAGIVGLLLMADEEVIWFVDTISFMMGTVSIFRCIYAFIVAACLFGDLFDARLCNGLHAMPMRREGWLITNLVSGMVFALIPSVVCGVVAAVLLKEFWWIALLWQGSNLLQFVFFFGVAVFSAMCAGKRLGMMAIYAMINFFSVLILWVARSIYEPLLPGVVLSEEWFKVFCPVVTMVASPLIHPDMSASSVTCIPENWQYLCICAGVGAAFMAAGWRLYCRRKLETAGNFISFRAMGIFFQLCYTVTIGTMLHGMSEAFAVGNEKNYALLVLGILIGFLTGWMLLERTVKIFTKNMFLWFGIFALLFTGSIGITIADPLGSVEYIPQTEQIEKACVFPYEDWYYYNPEELEYMTAEEELEQLRQIHQQMITYSEPDNEAYDDVYVRYDMKNGHSVTRKYWIPAELETKKQIMAFFGNAKNVFPASKWETIRQEICEADIYISDNMRSKDISLTDPQELQGLLDAIEADCQAGNLAQHDYFHPNQAPVGKIALSWDALLKAKNGKKFAYSEKVIIYEDCINTVAFLKTLGLV